MNPNETVRIRSLLGGAGLDSRHEALGGAKAAIGLETSLRNWATSLGWAYDPDKQTLDKVVNWLRQNDHITADEAARLHTDTRVRNHCAHGRWTLLEQGQVEHLIATAEYWTQRIASLGIVNTPILNRASDVVLERRSPQPRIARWVRWAFIQDELVLRSARGFALGIYLLMVPVLLFSSGLVLVFRTIPNAAHLSSIIARGDQFTALMIPMIFVLFSISLVFAIAGLCFTGGFLRYSQASDTALAAGSRFWVTSNARRTMLLVRRSGGPAKLTIAEFSGTCAECDAELDLVQSSKPRAGVVAECNSFPADHRFKIDPSTLTGTRIAD